jgi:hypothetical protein
MREVKRRRVAWYPDSTVATQATSSRVPTRARGGRVVQRQPTATPTTRRPRATPTRLAPPDPAPDHAPIRAPKPRKVAEEDVAVARVVKVAPSRPGERTIIRIDLTGDEEEVYAFEVHVSKRRKRT